MPSKNFEYHMEGVYLKKINKKKQKKTVFHSTIVPKLQYSTFEVDQNDQSCPKTRTDIVLVLGQL